MKFHPQLEPFVAGAAAFPKPGSMPVEDYREVVRAATAYFPPVGLPIGAVEDRTIDGPAGDLRLRIYRPASDAPAPLVVYFHGGGWVVGDLDTQDMICRGLCHGAEAIVVSVDYRLAPEHPFPAAPEDCWAATTWAADHAAELGATPGPIAVAGDSAGAVLAAGVALRARDAGGPAIAAQVLIYGSCNHPAVELPSMVAFRDAPFLSVADLHWFWSQYLADPTRDQDHPLASPARAATHADLPPTLVQTAEIDPSRDDAERYGEILKAAGVSVETRRYVGMPHGFVSFLGLIDGAGEAIADASAFLKTRFAAAHVDSEEKA